MKWVGDSIRQFTYFRGKARLSSFCSHCCHKHERNLSLLHIWVIFSNINCTFNLTLNETCSTPETNFRWDYVHVGQTCNSAIGMICACSKQHRDSPVTAPPHHSALRPFCMTAGSRAIAVTRVCSELESKRFLSIFVATIRFLISMFNEASGNISLRVTDKCHT
jgi:hypothetical protein